jgi:uncharacterized protein YxjI
MKKSEMVKIIEKVIKSNEFSVSKKLGFIKKRSDVALDILKAIEAAGMLPPTKALTKDNKEVLVAVWEKE